MAYNGAIPNASDFISASQQQIKDNFTAIDSSTFGFAVDHVTLTDATNGGQHKKVTFNQVTADPSQTFPQSMLYTKNSGTTPNRTTGLYWSYKPETGADVVQQLAGAANLSANGYVTLVGGLILQWGSVLITNGTTSASAGFPIPFPTQILSMVVTPQTNQVADAQGVAWNPNQGSAPFTSFTITRNGTNGTTSQFWIALGN